MPNTIGQKQKLNYAIEIICNSVNMAVLLGMIQINTVQDIKITHDFRFGIWRQQIGTIEQNSWKKPSLKVQKLFVAFVNHNNKENSK